MIYGPEHLATRINQRGLVPSLFSEMARSALVLAVLFMLPLAIAQATCAPGDVSIVQVCARGANLLYPSLTSGKGGMVPASFGQGSGAASIFCLHCNHGGGVRDGSAWSLTLRLGNAT